MLFSCLGAPDNILNDNDNNVGKVYIYSPIKSVKTFASSVETVNSVSEIMNASSNPEKNLVTKEFMSKSLLGLSAVYFSKMIDMLRKRGLIDGGEKPEEEEGEEGVVIDVGAGAGLPSGLLANGLANGLGNVVGNGVVGGVEMETVSELSNEEASLTEGVVFPAPPLFHSWELVGLLTSETLSIEVAHQLINASAVDPYIGNNVNSNGPVIPYNSFSATPFDITSFNPTDPSNPSTLSDPSDSSTPALHSPSVPAHLLPVPTVPHEMEKNRIKHDKRDLLDYYNDMYQINSGNRNMKEAYGSAVAFLGTTRHP